MSATELFPQDLFTPCAQVSCPAGIPSEERLADGKGRLGSVRTGEFFADRVAYEIGQGFPRAVSWRLSAVSVSSPANGDGHGWGLV